MAARILATQYSCLEESHDSQRGLLGCSPWGQKESDKSEANESSMHWMNHGSLVNNLFFYAKISNDLNMNYNIKVGYWNVISTNMISLKGQRTFKPGSGLMLV